jgi:hypothetical protein
MIRKTKNRVDPVEVFCRLRPLNDLGNEESCVKIIDESNLMLQMPEVILLRSLLFQIRITIF